MRDISFYKLDELLPNLSNYNIKYTDKPTKILKNVFATGPVPRICRYETNGAGLFQDQLKQVPDPITDDQSLIVNTKQGYVLVLGCCHAGIVNTMHHVWNFFPKKRLYGIIGGTHLSQASPERLQATVKFLKDIKCEFVAASHCTGITGKQFLQKELKENFLVAGVGTQLEFDESEEELRLKSSKDVKNTK